MRVQLWVDELVNALVSVVNEQQLAPIHTHIYTPTPNKKKLSKQNLFYLL
jgi:hypothetical protein